MADLLKKNHEQHKKLNSKILALTKKIEAQYPRLWKYIKEMGVTDLKESEITEVTLTSYNNALDSMLKKYQEEQSKNIQPNK